MIDWHKIANEFSEETASAEKYAAMAHELSGCERQVLMDMAWDEYSHAKHLHRMLHDHGVATDAHREILHKTKKQLEES